MRVVPLFPGCGTGDECVENLEVLRLILLKVVALFVADGGKVAAVIIVAREVRRIAEVGIHFGKQIVDRFVLFVDRFQLLVRSGVCHREHIVFAVALRAGEEQIAADRFGLVPGAVIVDCEILRRAEIRVFVRRAQRVIVVRCAVILNAIEAVAVRSGHGVIQERLFASDDRFDEDYRRTRLRIREGRKLFHIPFRSRRADFNAADITAFVDIDVVLRTVGIFIEEGGGGDVRRRAGNGGKLARCPVEFRVRGDGIPLGGFRHGAVLQRICLRFVAVGDGQDYLTVCIAENGIGETVDGFQRIDGGEIEVEGGNECRLHAARFADAVEDERAEVDVFHRAVFVVLVRRIVGIRGDKRFALLDIRERPGRCGSRYAVELVVRFGTARTGRSAVAARRGYGHRIVYDGVFGIGIVEFRARISLGKHRIYARLRIIRVNLGVRRIEIQQINDAVFLHKAVLGGVRGNLNIVIGHRGTVEIGAAEVEITAFHLAVEVADGVGRRIIDGIAVDVHARGIIARDKQFGYDGLCVFVAAAFHIARGNAHERAFDDVAVGIVGRAVLHAVDEVEPGVISLALLHNESAVGGNRAAFAAVRFVVFYLRTRPAAAAAREHCEHEREREYEQQYFFALFQHRFIDSFRSVFGDKPLCGAG